MGLIPKKAKVGDIIKLPPLFKGVSKEPLKIKVLCIDDCGNVEGELLYAGVRLLKFVYDRTTNEFGEMDV